MSVSKVLKTTAVLPLLFLVACGGGGGGSSPAPNPPISGPPPPPPPPPPPTGGPTMPPVPAAAPDGPDHLPANKGWQLVWSDEFNGSELDPVKWQPEVSCWGGGNNERQCYTDRQTNVDLVNGLLRLVAVKEEFTGPLYPQERNSPEQGSKSYTSGKVRTRGLADWKYGRFAARLKLPAGQGIWPAFWMLSAEDYYGTWPLSGEIDIMEAVNLGAYCADCQGGTSENRVHGALHFGNPWPANQLIGRAYTLPDAAQPDDNYHVYAIEWGDGRINWFVDDVHYFSADQTNWFTVSAEAAGNDLAPFDRPFYLMFNLAVGGNWPEGSNELSFDPNTIPSQLLVDWVRVYTCDTAPVTGLDCMAPALSGG